MFYQYGLFKPLANMKVSRPATLRQFIPPLFVLFLILGAIGSLFIKLVPLITIICLSFYLFIDLIFSLNISVKNSQPLLIIYLPWVFFIIHISYGFGYLNGIVKFVILHQKKSMAGHTR
jgi:hypothetical protein